MEKALVIRRNLIIALILLIGSALLFLFYKMGNSWEFAIRFRGIKVVAIIVVAGCVAFSSVTFQTLTNNRILTPSIMGFESLYLLIQTIIVFVYGDQTFKVLSHFSNFAISVSGMIIFSFLQPRP
jgi:iron complex transport system permease protein